MFLKAGFFHCNLGFFEGLIWVYVKYLIGSPDREAVEQEPSDRAERTSFAMNRLPNILLQK